MCQPQTGWAYVAFKKGSYHDVAESAIEVLTWSPFVHCEVRLYPHAYAAYEDLYPCFRKSQVCDIHPSWDMIPIPISNTQKAQQFLHDIIAARLPYRFPWEVMVPQCVLKEVETDLDCTKPYRWGSVFCSQATLLFLRRCAVEHILMTPNQHLLFELDSNGVSPAKLHRLLLRTGLAPCQTQVAQSTHMLSAKQPRGVIGCSGYSYA